MAVVKQNEEVISEVSAVVLVSCPTLILTVTTLQGTPSLGPPRLKKAPAAGHPLPQGGEGQRNEACCKRSCGTGH
jgi:hypothetical protein